jgi:4-amino-4-deoxy-L-arabinose transferase-like glycosyltransferase
VPGGAGAASPRWFAPCLGAAFVVGLVIRLLMVAWVQLPSEPGFLVNYDPIFYHRQAQLVADGRGFIAPYRLDAQGHGPVAPSAGHPPLLVVVLAGASFVGLDGWGAHRVLTALIGAALVPLIGLWAARLAGARAGVVAAVIAAVTPNLWLNDGVIKPESLAAILLVLAALVAHRAWDDGRARVPLALGALIALAALARGEAIALLVLLVVPLALMRPARRDLGWLRTSALAFGAALVVLLPWVAYNVARFERPVIISTAQDTTLGGANCPLAYRGAELGYWTQNCFADIQRRGLEESVEATEIRRRALHDARDDAGRLPVVAVARVARTLGLYRTSSTIAGDALQNRPRPAGWAGLAAWWLLVPFAVAGAVRLHRRGVPLLPLVSFLVLSLLTAVAFYGNVRFRLPADLSVIVLAATALAGPAGPRTASPTQDPTPD